MDHLQAIPAAMNTGLDSWLDVRLSLLLFRSVYTSNGTALLDNAAQLVLSALSVNPYARSLLILAHCCGTHSGLHLMEGCPHAQQRTCRVRTE